MLYGDQNNKFLFNGRGIKTGGGGGGVTGRPLREKYFLLLPDIKLETLLHAAVYVNSIFKSGSSDT